MKYLIFDANNIASLSFFRAKSLMMKEIKEKLDVDNEDSLLEEARQNIMGFASHLFFGKIHSIIRSNKDRRVIFVWDGRYGSVWRKKENTSYKANRNHDGDKFYSIFIDMMNKCRDILELYPVLQFAKDDAEADDLIYSIVKYIDDDIKVVTTDSDMIQLSQQFSNTVVWNPIKKKNHEIPEYDYVRFKSIVGDKSDNIIGLKKVGPKTALKIMNGEKQITDEQNELIEQNMLIIDLSKNPHEKSNSEYVNPILESATSKEWPYDLEQIKKEFFDLKLKNQIDKFGSTAKLLKALP